MSTLLNHLAHQVETAPDLPAALTTVATRVQEILPAAVCAFYLADGEGTPFQLVAHVGLSHQSTAPAQQRSDQGLIGWVAERLGPVHLADAPRHPRFQPLVERTGATEATLHAFLGVPLIQQRRVFGVIVAQDYATRWFTPSAVEFLVALAARMAPILYQSQRKRGPSESAPAPAADQALHGIAGAPGVVIAPVRVPDWLSALERVPDRTASDPAAEAHRLRTAIAAVEAQLRTAGARLAASLPPADQDLLTRCRMLLASDSLIQRSLAAIQAGRWAPAAWRDAVLERTRLLEQAEDPYLRDRADDLRDLGHRVLEQMQPVAPPESAVSTPGPWVLAAEEISVAHLAALPPEQVAGLICLRGSALSHVALLARAMGIPAVMGLGEQPLSQFTEGEVIVDGYRGQVFLKPDSARRAEYQRILRADAELVAELGTLRTLSTATLDGHTIPLYAKAGLPSDIETVRAAGAEGIGLYRTEFAFMVRETFPSEAEQYALYRPMLEAFAPQPVVMRTLDIGGDKSLPYFTIQEQNPFLGWRGMRFTLDHPDIFLTQLRALLRANIGLGNLRILFPMITTVEEADEALRLVRRASQELRAAGQAVADPPIGVMIEVPAAAWQAEQLARRADFLSVGTNDLTQYMLAVDRDNARVAGLYDSLHPALIQAVAHIIASGHHAGRRVNVSGEMASDPAAAVLLLGLGADSLNASTASAPRVKWAIRGFRWEQSQELAQQALRLETAAEVRDLLHQALIQAGRGRLVQHPS